MPTAAAAVHKAPQYRREKKSLSCTAAPRVPWRLRGRRRATSNGVHEAGRRGRPFPTCLPRLVYPGAEVHEAGVQVRRRSSCRSSQNYAAIWVLLYGLLFHEVARFCFLSPYTLLGLKEDLLPNFDRFTRCTYHLPRGKKFCTKVVHARVCGLVLKMSMVASSTKRKELK